MYLLNSVGYLEINKVYSLIFYGRYLSFSKSIALLLYLSVQISLILHPLSPVSPLSVSPTLITPTLNIPSPILPSPYPFPQPLDLSLPLTSPYLSPYTFALFLKYRLPLSFSTILPLYPFSLPISHPLSIFLYTIAMPLHRSTILHLSPSLPLPLYLLINLPLYRYILALLLSYSPTLLLSYSPTLSLFLSLYLLSASPAVSHYTMPRYKTHLPR